MSLINAQVPVIAFIGPSGSGKTTLLRYVVGLLNEQGLRVGVVKQARADFDIDQPGKDSYELRKAGIERLLLGSEQQSALLIEHPQQQEPELDNLLLLFKQDDLDLILVEGFNTCPITKIEICRQNSRAPRFPSDPWVVAVASDDETLTAAIPVFHLDDCWAVADFIQNQFCELNNKTMLVSEPL